MTNEDLMALRRRAEKTPAGSLERRAFALAQRQYAEEIKTRRLADREAQCAARNARGLL